MFLLYTMMLNITIKLFYQQHKVNIIHHLNFDLILITVKEIRQQISDDILATADLWKNKGLNKSRRTQNAFTRHYLQSQTNYTMNYQQLLQLLVGIIFVLQI